MARIAITCDCTCDLTEKLLKEYRLERIYCHIITNQGRFSDFHEITSRNVFDYIESGGKPITESPMTVDFVELFQRKLQKADQVIHISLSSGISDSYENAKKAIEQLHLEDKVFVVDSMQLSTGTGHVAIKASELVSQRLSAEEIVKELEQYKTKVSSSFLVQDLQFLSMNGKVSERIAKLCKAWHLHPLIKMKNGKFGISKVFIGDFEKAQRKYIRGEMKHFSDIDKHLAFITHAGASVRELEIAQNEIARIGKFDNLYITEASATISSNSGPHTIGLLYVMN